MADLPPITSFGHAGLSDEVQDSQVSSDILKDVVAYVEVRTGNDNRSAAVKRVLETMGATVDDKFTNRVTHVIFKEGKKRTMEKAQKLGAHLLSVLWVDRCKELQQKVPESEFIANTERCSTPPPGVRWKKYRSMQPRDFDDEVARSTERLQKRKRKVDPHRLLQGTESATPYHAASGHVLVVDTQPRSPSDPMSFNFYSPVIIPNTPPSMQARLDKLIREKEAQRQGETVDSPLYREGETPLQRILFADHSSTAEEESETSVSETSISTNKTDNIEKNRSSSKGEATTKYYASRTEASAKCFHSSGQAKYTFSTKSPRGRSDVSDCIRTTREEDTENSVLPNKLPARQARGRRSLPPQTFSQTEEEQSQPLSQMLQQSQGRNQPRHSLGNCLPRVALARLKEEQITGSGVESSSSSNSVSKVVTSSNNDYQNGGSVQRKAGATEKNNTNFDLLSKCEKEKAECVNGLSEGSSEQLENRHIKTASQIAQLTRRGDIASSARTKRKLLNPSDEMHIFSQSPAENQQVSMADCISQARRNKRKSCDIDAIFPSASLPAPKRSRVSGSSSSRENKATRQSLSQSRSNISGNPADAFTSDRTKQKLSKVNGSKKRAPNDESATASDSSLHSASQTSTSLGTSMSMMFCDTPTLNSINKRLPPPRSSIAEFKPQKTRRQSSRSSLRLASQWQIANTEDPHSFTSQQKLRQSCMPSIVMTSMHKPEQEMAIAAVKKLGVFRIEDKVSKDSTHVVYGEPRRTLNLLHGLARGCWIIDKEWVTQSVKAAKWLPEIDFEADEDIPKAKDARLAREEKPPGTYKCCIFEGIGSLFISNSCTPPRAQMLRLLSLCGAKVTDSICRADFYIGDHTHDEKISIKPVWVLDCVSQMQLLPMENYILAINSTPKSGSSPEY